MRNLTWRNSTRQTPTHVYFWGGPLSNWSQGDWKFPGARAFEYLLPLLVEEGVAYPASGAFSSRLLASFSFVCGEQWMMAMKGWFFERDLELAEKAVDDNEFQELRGMMLGGKAPPKYDTEKRAMYDSCLCRCLRTSSPKEQKGSGRQCRNFTVEVWDQVSVHVVVACQIARAEVDRELEKIYLDSGTRTFVEGSPFDTIWGVGLMWSSADIEDTEKWQGENRLGVCHGIASKAFRGLRGESKSAEAEAGG